ncbi:hypothetical protein IKE98_03360 [Candidatus Saccharibacteria bacterium]|nr:hypothetical protein [Candidatus Saccharibacteria bacterium]
MNKRVATGVLVALMLALCPVFLFSRIARAEEANMEAASETEDAGTTNISLTPVSKVLQISSGSVYDNTFTVNNDGSRELEIEVFAAPYSYIYSEETGAYQLGFNNENSFTQMSRWITFKSDDGSYKETIRAKIAPNDKKDVEYRITTPGSIPGGGQYAVIFARTVNGVTSSNGIKTEASPGMVVYGRSLEGESVVTSEISNLIINQSINDGEKTKNNINAIAKVKNTGNVDFTAVGKMTVDAIIGGGHYETPSNQGRVSIIPEAELTVSDEWTETPGFGIFKVTWTVSAADKTETTEKIVIINIIPVILIIIIVLTIIIIGCIMASKKRKARRSRLAV